MENKTGNLIERYVYDVARRLPEKEREKDGFLGPRGLAPRRRRSRTRCSTGSVCAIASA